MFIKYEAKNEQINISCFDEEGISIDNKVISKVGLYNKVKDSYYLIQEFTDLSNITFDQSKMMQPDKLFIDIYVGNRLYKSKVEVNYTSTFKRVLYNLSYTSTAGSRLTTNQFLRRCTFGLPKWSTAYKEDISNYSKTFYPIFYIAERNFYLVQQALENNLNNITTTKYHYSKKPVGMVSMGGKNIPITHIRDKEMITDISKEVVSTIKPSLFSKSLTTIVYPLVLDKVFNKLFIKSDKICTFRIEGINGNRLPISESVYCDGINYTCTFNEYKKITAIKIIKLQSDEEPSVICTNFLNLQKDQLNFIKNYKITPAFDKAKEYNSPLYIFNKDTNSINSYYNKEWMSYGDFEDSYYCPELAESKAIFITDDNDVVGLTDTALSKEDYEYLNLENDEKLKLEENVKQIVVSQLRKDLTTTMPIFSSNNNNTIVTTTDDSIMTDNKVEFEINTKNFISSFGSQEVYIYLEVDGNRMYLTDEGSFVQDKTRFLLTNKNSLYIAYGTENISYVTLVLEYNNTSYQTSCIKNIIKVNSTNVICTDLYHNGTNLISEYLGQFYKLTLNKTYAQLINDTTVNVQTNELVSIVNTEGNKDGDSINR